MAVRLSKQSWEAIRSAYMRGRTALELAKQFDIAAGTIHRRSATERWRDSRPLPAHLPAMERTELMEAITRLAVAVENLTRQTSAHHEA